MTMKPASPLAGAREDVNKSKARDHTLTTKRSSDNFIVFLFGDEHRRGNADKPAHHSRHTEE